MFSNGELFTWGDGQYGATGLGSSGNTFAPMRVDVSGNPKFAQISCGKRHSLALDNMGTVYVTGDNTYRQLGNSNINIMMGFKQLSDFSFPTKQVAAGSEHSLVLT